MNSGWVFVDKCVKSISMFFGDISRPLGGKREHKTTPSSVAAYPGVAALAGKLGNGG